MELSEWLIHQIAADEAEAKYLGPCDCAIEGLPLLHGLRCSVRVLADCEAKRRIVELHKETLIERLDDEFPGDSCDALCVVDNDDFPCVTLRLLALPYSDREGYDPAWRP